MKTKRGDSDHEASVVLADETRYRIYRAIAEHPGEDVTVADIARRFGLHPNVARMHLGKLERGGFVTTGLRRSSGGGRPAKALPSQRSGRELRFPAATLRAALETGPRGFGGGRLTCRCAAGLS